MSEFGQMRTVYTAKGLARYEVEAAHSLLHKYQVIRGDDPNVVAARANALGAQWDEAWARRDLLDQKREAREDAAQDVSEKKQLALDRTSEANAAIEAVSNVLLHTLDIDDTIDWSSLKSVAPYSVPEPKRPAPPAMPRQPQMSPEPQEADPQFAPRIGLLDWLSSSRKRLRVEEAHAGFTKAQSDWRYSRDESNRQYQAALEQHAVALQELEVAHKAVVEQWQADADAYCQQRNEGNLAVDRRQAQYMSSDPESITGYCSMVLENSSYPECFSQRFELEYNPSNKIVIVDYQLPAPDDLPSVVDVKYVVSSDSFSEKRMAQKPFEQLYDTVLCRVALRTIHELFEADAVSALEAVVFNGWVHSTDRATGQENDACVLSVQAGREEFLGLALRAVDARACLKKLKGVAAARLHSLTPVAPLLSMSRDDRRFVPGKEVADSLEAGDNLAAMDWEDFEHLIRELFEKEFAAHGGEVKVTQASRDGGVDAVIFDPDPIHGGKTVVQAKRYTNTVGVAAVRDLYGTMINEGANKGILVTTSDYGPDAYGFAKGKPLVLLAGGNLLYLLESHGHRARIDLREAKLLLGESTPG